jgi:hypothetical protein
VEIALHAVADALAEGLLELFLMMKTTRRKPARQASNREKSMMKCPSASTGVICLSPPKRLPMPAAMMTSVGSEVFTVKRPLSQFSFSSV